MSYPNKAQNIALLRRNNSIVRAANAAALGVRAWGVNTMADLWRDRRDQVARYRILEQETTDPLAAGLLRDIVSELEADLRALAETDGGGAATRDRTLEPGVIEFYGRKISCLVRNLSEAGAALNMVSPCAVPDRFTLALPLEGISHRCRLVWRRDVEVGVAFQ
jgi:PilZ domain